MKNSSLRLLPLLLIGLLCWPAAKPIDADPGNDKLLYELSLQLLLTENYEEAEACFAKLVAASPNDAVLLTNRGINQAMWGLSLIKKGEMQDLIKYVFPFEVRPNSGIRGEITDEHRFITQCFEAAVRQFEQVIQLEPEGAGGYLNLASAQALLSRWAQQPALLRTAFNNLNQALAKAPANSTTKGYGYIVQGIIYDYLGNEAKRDDAFQLALTQHQVQPDTRLSSLVERNRSIASGGEAIFVQASGENYNVFEDQLEAIDGISLQQLKKGTSLPVSNTYADMGEAKIYGKDYPQSTLYVYYHSDNHYLLFHRTGSQYPNTSMKGIALGHSEARVKKAYGEPARILPAAGGKYLFYKKAKLLFFIGTDGTVQSWMVWLAKV